MMSPYSRSSAIACLMPAASRLSRKLYLPVHMQQRLVPLTLPTAMMQCGVLFPLEHRWCWVSQVAALERQGLKQRLGREVFMLNIKVRTALLPAGTCISGKSWLLRVHSGCCMAAGWAARSDPLEDSCLQLAAPGVCWGAQVGWPTSVVVSQGALAQYQVLFRHLFELELASRALHATWRAYQATRPLFRCAPGRGSPARCTAGVIHARSGLTTACKPP